jgi:hypothetical protein
MKLSLKAFLFASLLSSVAVAAPTDSVILGGNVASSLTIEATPTAAASALPLSGGLKIVKVGDTLMSTNNEQGLSVTASNGSLTKDGGTSIAFLTTTVVDGAAAPALAVFDDVLLGTSAAGELAQDLYIMYTPAALQDPGDYAGVINLVVTDN